MARKTKDRSELETLKKAAEEVGLRLRGISDKLGSKKIIWCTSCIECTGCVACPTCIAFYRPVDKPGGIRPVGRPGEIRPVIKPGDIRQAAVRRARRKS